MKQSIIYTFISSLFFMLFNSSAFAGDLDEAIYQLQKQWAVTNYETAEADVEKAFEQLTQQAQEVVSQYPDNAEPLVWNAIIVSSDAGKSGGLSALGKVKEARNLLLKAEKINPLVLDGSIYTSLGSLYYQVPGWPIGFGDDDKAQEYLQKALELNPEGIDSNYFYGDYLIEEGKYKEAKIYLQKALKAPARPQRPLADKGRHGDIKAKLKKVEGYL